MSQKLAGQQSKSKVSQIRELWKKQEQKYNNAKNSVEKEQIKSQIYESIRIQLGMPKKQKGMIRQTVNILLGYKPKPKTK
jgi:hypothetical protein